MVNSVVREHIEPSVRFVQAFKEFAFGSDIDLFIKATENGVDDSVLAKIRSVLPGVLEALEATKTCLAKPTPQEQLECFASQLAKRNDPIQSAIMAKFASLLAIALSDDQLKQVQADVLTAAYYAKMKAKANKDL